MIRSAMEFHQFDSPKDTQIAERKKGHLDLALSSIVEACRNDSRFYYEPLLSAHPNVNDELSCQFLGKKMNYPIWFSSMTGGTELANKINKAMAKVAKEFGLGMGLGSCRAILDCDERWDDFNLRPILGEKVPFYANLGIAQIEQSINSKTKFTRILEMVERLNVDGLIVHVNPIQEWLQPEGDRINLVPIETIEAFVNKFPLPVIIKEVGQGFGPKSLARLIESPVAGIELAGFGGTNFSQLEIFRGGSIDRESSCLVEVGHSASEMIDFIHRAEINCKKQIIVSGGIRNFLDGHYLINKINAPAVYGMAGKVLEYAKQGDDVLKDYVNLQIKGLQFANRFLEVKDKEINSER